MPKNICKTRNTMKKIIPKWLINFIKKLKKITSSLSLSSIICTIHLKSIKHLHRTVENGGDNIHASKPKCQKL